MSVRVLGIYREADFSPGKVEADAAILEAVLAELEGDGVRTAAVKPEALPEVPVLGFELVLAMCQGEHALGRLSELEAAGTLVVNSSRAIRNCYRDRMGETLARAGVPIPRGAMVTARETVAVGGLAAAGLAPPVYVKRGDFHALSPEDVRRAADLEELGAVLAGFAARGIERAYVQREVAGEALKFYGVGDGAYFAALARDGGEPAEPFKERLRSAASAAAAALGLETWGGDAVVGDSELRIIDFNDWPSYSRVRNQAAGAIAQRCITLLRGRGFEL